MGVLDALFGVCAFGGDGVAGGGGFRAGLGQLGRQFGPCAGFGAGFLLKVELLSKDEGALFLIANQLNLRHRRVDQRSDYDEVHLDWLFWWYLATLDLTDRLLARQAGGATVIKASTP